MPTGISPGRADVAIDEAVALGTWIQMHLGDPGADGTGSPALETTRIQASFAPASGGEARTNAILQWPIPVASENWSHFTMWTGASAGDFLWSGTVTANPTQAGQPFTVLAGDLRLFLTGAA